MNLESKIESLLFFKGEQISLKKIADILNETEEEILNAISNLENSLSGRGIVLLKKESSFMLGTSPDMSDIIEGLIKEDLNKDLGKAGLETLSIVLYLGPVTRSRVDYIRGVNSNFILRNLMIRGLVEKINNPEDQRSFLYKPTFELLAHLGVSNIEELPEYSSVRKEIENSEKALDEKNTEEASSSI